MPSNIPPALPPLARNSSMTWALKSVGVADMERNLPTRHAGLVRRRRPREDTGPPPPRVGGGDGPRRGGLLAADDVFRDVGGDVADFFFAQHAFEGRHPAAAVGHLFFGAGLGFGQRHRRQVRTAVAAVTGGAVADRAFFGEHFFAGRRVGGGTATARFGFFAAFFFAGFFGFFGRLLLLRRFLAGVLGAFGFCFQAFRSVPSCLSARRPRSFRRAASPPASCRRRRWRFSLRLRLRTGSPSCWRRRRSGSSRVLCRFRRRRRPVRRRSGRRRRGHRRWSPHPSSRIRGNLFCQLILPVRHVVGGEEARRVEAGRRRPCRSRCRFRLRSYFGSGSAGRPARARRSASRRSTCSFPGRRRTAASCRHRPPRSATRLIDVRVGSSSG